MEKEIRIAEIRTSLDADHKPIIEGHAAVFNQPSLEIFKDSPGWREIIKPGAFTNAIKTDDVRALFNHNENQILGRVSSRTLMLAEDEIGLKVRIFPSDTSYARDLLTNIRDHNISQMSFGFSVADDGQEIDRLNKLRSITRVAKLYDVSPVTEPAYPQTDVSLRSLFTENLFDPEIEAATFLIRSQIRREQIERAQNYLSQRRISYVIRH